MNSEFNPAGATTATFAIKNMTDETQPLDATLTKQHNENNIAASLSDKIDELGLTPMNWRERWVIRKIKDTSNRSIWWDILGPIVWVTTMTKLLMYTEAGWIVYVLVGLAAVLIIEESMRYKALGSMITRLNKSEQAAPRNR